ncbi:hypothetical protein JTB14_016209 [Gonioctena quinquepunctata]|nr:hypothetical protein JTB14_016209 [Gonioctena quinquepunctata]
MTFLCIFSFDSHYILNFERILAIAQSLKLTQLRIVCEDILTCDNCNETTSCFIDSARMVLPILMALLIMCHHCRIAEFFEQEDIYYTARKPYLGKSTESEVLLGRDKNGCYCRVFNGVLTVCFGRSLCDKLPLEFNITTPNLGIMNTHVTKIKAGDLDDVHHVENLRIEGNFNLTSIEPKVFQNNFINLKNLSISSNPFLHYLHKNTFLGLINLRQLLLIKNGFSNIKVIMQALRSPILPALIELSLNENKFPKIDEKDLFLLKNSSLEELDLSFCQLEYLHPYSLVYLKNLRVLKLGENIFNISTLMQFMERSVRAGLPLETVSLNSVGFRISLPKKLLEIIAASRISNLNLARNQFDVIPSDAIPWMPNLTSLDLSGVMVSDIADDAFVNLPNLKTLTLGENKLSSLPKSVLLLSLTRLDLQHNIRIGNNGISFLDISNGVFSMMKQLKYLNLNFNGIFHLFPRSFSGLENLEVLNLKNCSIFHIQNRTFAYMNKLKFINLENNLFISNNYPFGLSPESLVGLENLEILLLARNRITYLSKSENPLKYLKSLKYLGLEGNYIETLSPTLFKPLVHIRRIHLAFNQIVGWEEALFENNIALEYLLLHNNKITRITTAMLDDFSNLTGLSLSLNSLSCDCMSFEYIYDWLRKKRKPKILKVLAEADSTCINHISLGNQTPHDLVEYFQAVQTDIIHCYTSHLLLLSGLLFITAILLAVLFYWCRWHIRYWMFLTKLYLGRKGKVKLKTSQGICNYEYDVFVSYSNEDSNFVIRLVTMLENYEPFLKLCVYERDFRVGSFISECVLECLAKSRKILLIVSDNYVKSHWCRWESHIAEHHRLFFGDQDGGCVDDAMVLIKLGSLNKAHLTPMLKYLLKTKIYLEWNADENKQKTFWSKLRNTLAPSKEGHNIIESTHM